MAVVGLFNEFFAIDLLGDVVGNPGATVHFYESGTTTYATRYDSAGNNPVAGSFVLDANGNYDLYAVPGRYDVKIGTVTRPIEVKSTNVLTKVTGYTKAGLPAAGSSGLVARVTDAERGVWVDDGSKWIRLSDTIQLKDFAVGDGVANDTSAVQLWLDAVATYHLPGFANPGRYLTTGGLVTTSGQTEVHIFGPQAGWETDRAATFINRTDNITLRMDGGNSTIEHILFDGRDAGGNNAGGIGLVLGPNHKITANNVTARYFKEAGFVADGTQNSTFSDIDSQLNKINIWITNECRTCLLVNPSATDETGSINAYMDAIDPAGVELWIGRRTNSYITMKTADVDIPGDLTVLHGILERHQRHDYNIRISHGWGYIRLMDVNIHGAKTALIRIDSGVAPYAVPLRLILDDVSLANYDLTPAAVPTFSDASGGVNFEVFSPLPPGFQATNRWFETRIREGIDTEDYGGLQMMLAAPPSFGLGIGSWVTYGGTSVVSHTNRRLRIAVDGSGFGGVCVCRPRWLSVALGGPFNFTANHVIVVKYHCTTKVPTSVKVQADLTGSPFQRDIGTISAVGTGEFTYLCQGDETGRIAVGFGVGSGNVDFAYFAAAVY